MRPINYLFIGLIVFYSCKSDEGSTPQPQLVQFGFSLSESTSADGRTASVGTPTSVIVTVEDNNGNEVLSNERISLIPFGGGFASNPINLIPSQYILTSFLVLNEGDTAIYAAPLEGSELADVVDDPLPIEFSVVQNEVTNVPVEILRIDDVDASVFGYATFIPVFVETLQFEIVIFELDTITDNIQTIGANLIIISDNDTIRNLDLIAGINLITVIDNQVEYTLVVKRDSSLLFEQALTLTELQTFAPGNPLEIIVSTAGDSESSPPSGEITSGLFVESGQDFQNIDGFNVDVTVARALDLGDIDNDGDVDAVTVGFQNSRITIWLNDGNGFFDIASQLNFGAGDVALHDFDRDGDLDMIVTLFNAVSNGMNGQVYLNSGNGTFTLGQVIAPFRPNISGNINLGDMNSDGFIDVVTSGGTFFSNGDGTFNTDNTFSSLRGAALGDMDDDGDLDILDFTPRIIFNSGSGTGNDGVLSYAEQSEVNLRDVIAADVDNDNDLDIITLNNDAEIVSYRNENLEFTPVATNIGIIYQIFDLGDIDNDGDLDIFAVVNNNSNRVFLNQGDGSFLDTGQRLGTSESLDVKLADLNGDGILDAFVANASLIGGNRVYFGQP